MCVAMTSDHPVGLWETKNCTLEKSFICEYPRTGYTTSTTTTTTTLAPTCPPGWMVYSNYCYKVNTLLLNCSYIIIHGNMLQDQSTMRTRYLCSTSLWKPRGTTPNTQINCSIFWFGTFTSI